MLSTSQRWLQGQRMRKFSTGRSAVGHRCHRRQGFRRVGIPTQAGERRRCDPSAARTDSQKETSRRASGIRRPLGELCWRLFCRNRNWRSSEAAGIAHPCREGACCGVPVVAIPVAHSVRRPARTELAHRVSGRRGARGEAPKRSSRSEDGTPAARDPRRATVTR